MRIALFGDASSVNVRSWAEALVRSGADVELLSFAPSWGPHIPVHDLGSGAQRLGKAAYLVAAPRARQIIRRIRPELVIGYYVTGYGTLATLCGSRPTVQVAVGNDVLVNPPGTWTNHFARMNLHHADLIVTWAPHLAEAALAFNVLADRVFILPRGIDLTRFRPLHAASVAAHPRILCTRALDPYYRNDILVAALALAPGASLTFVGDGPARPALELMTERLDVADRVHFAGIVPNDQLPAVLAEHDIYVTASPTDGVSASLLEAMAVGLLPVVPDTEANREWITDGQTGVLVRSHAPSAFAASIREASALLVRPSDWGARNRELVARRADLDHNTVIFLDRFRLLVEEASRRVKI